MTTDFDRRRLFLALGGALGAGFAGCLGDDDDDGETDPDDHDDHDGHGTDDTGDDTGDDPDDATGSDGLAYAFLPDSIVVFDPESGDVEAERAISPGNRNWGDVRLTPDRETLLAVDGSLDQVAIVDANSRDVREWVDVGAGPVHAFLPTPTELWAHADDEGTFYVVDVDEGSVTDTVEASRTGEGHGKLVHHDDFDPDVWATNVTDPAAIRIDTEESEVTEYVELADVGGTHYVDYCSENGLLYVEVQGEHTAVLDPETGDEVDRLDAVGGLATSPDGDVLGIWTDDAVTFYDATSEDSPELSSASIDDGGPDGIEFVTVEERLLAFVPTVDGLSIVDVAAGAVTASLSAGAFDDDAPFASRHVDSGDGMVFLTADVDGTVAVIDPADESITHEVSVGEGVERVKYVPT